MLLAVEGFPDELAEGAWGNGWWALQCKRFRGRGAGGVNGGEDATSSSDCVAQIREVDFLRQNDPTLRLEVGRESFDATTVVIGMNGGDDKPEGPYEP